MDGGGPGQAGTARYRLDVIALAGTARTTRKTGGKAAAGPDAARVADRTAPPASGGAGPDAGAVALPPGVPGGQAAGRVWGVLLGADAEMTATAVTLAAGVARGTVSATLNALEKSGAVLRIPGDGKAGRADLWVLAGGVREGQGVVNAPAPSADESAPEASGRGADGTAATSVVAVVSSGALGAVSGQRLRQRGQLEAEVLAVLVAGYPAEFGATALSRALNGASSGAIANALERLCGKEKVLRTCEAPKRYRAVDPPAVAEVQPMAS